MDIDKLIVDNMGLVYHQLHKFNRAYDDDAYSCAVEALIKAANTYDDSKSVKFATYASVCIYNGIAYYLRGLNKKRKLEVVYFSDEVSPGSDITYADVLHSDALPSDEIMLEERNASIWKVFDKAYNELTNGVPRTIIRLWRESDFTMNQSQLAKEAGVTQSYVSRVLNAFKHKIKKELEDCLC